MKAEVTRLPSGLRVASLTMPSLETVSIGVYADVGTRHEEAPCAGVSHMLEHMVFKGTKRRSARQIAEEIEAVGGHLNAYTTRDLTAFYARVLKEDTALAVDMLADLVTNATFEAHEVARERDVICQEIGQAIDTPDDIVFDHLQAAAFDNQPMGFSILGTPASVAAIDGATLAAYRARHYRADTLIIAAAGKIGHEPFVRLVEQAFAGLPAGSRAEPLAARYGGGERRDHRKLEQVHLAFAFEGLSYHHDDIYALQLYSTMLGGGMSSRLFQTVREEHGLAYAVFSDVAAYADTGLVTIYAGTSAEDAPKALALIGAVTQGMTETTDEAEIARARAQLKAGLAMALESSSAQAEQLGRHLLMYDRPVPAEELLARIDAVDGAHIRRVAREVLNRGRLSFATVGPRARLGAYQKIAAAFGI
ncbi:MAG: M16 family metallopeptidase [Pseudomonadota bacterium]